MRWCVLPVRGWGSQQKRHRWFPFSFLRIIPFEKFENFCRFSDCLSAREFCLSLSFLFQTNLFLGGAVDYSGQKAAYSGILAFCILSGVIWVVSFPLMIRFSRRCRREPSPKDRECCCTCCFSQSEEESALELDSFTTKRTTSGLTSFSSRTNMNTSRAALDLDTYRHQTKGVSTKDLSSSQSV